MLFLEVEVFILILYDIKNGGKTQQQQQQKKKK